jgi:hypothetical protein
VRELINVAGLLPREQNDDGGPGICIITAGQVLCMLTSWGTGKGAGVKDGVGPIMHGHGSTPQ